MALALAVVLAVADVVLIGMSESGRTVGRSGPHPVSSAAHATVRNGAAAGTRTSEGLESDTSSVAQRGRPVTRDRSSFVTLTVTRTVGAPLHDDDVTDDEPALTVRDRLTAAGLSAERIEQHMTAGRVRVDGEPVTDLDTPAPAGTRVVVWAE